MDFVDVLRLPRTVQNARRVQEIVGVLARHGAADLLRRIGLLSRWRSKESSKDDVRWERRLRFALEELGPTFIKLGQLLASRPEIMGAALAGELRLLQDHAAPFPLERVRMQIERELGRPVEELFASFDEAPIAAASIGQVHRARLAEGDRLVVKVRRPGLGEIIARDLDILTAIAVRVDEHAAELLPLSAAELVGQLSRAVRREIDFRHEASHLARFEQLYGQDPAIHCVRVFRNLSAERVLTMEFVEGVRPDDLAALARLGVDRVELARTILRVSARQVLEQGFYHADPHPGNLLVTPGPVLTWIDLGLIGRLDRRERDDLLELLAAVVGREPSRIVSLLDRMELLPRTCDRRSLERDVLDLLEFLDVGAAQPVRLSRLMIELFDTLMRHRASAPPGMVLLAKSFSVIEALVFELAPDLVPMEALTPLAKQLYMERALHPEFWARDWIRAGERAARLLQRAPARIDGILTQLEAGELRVQVRSEPHAELIDRVARGTKRVVVAVLASAGFVGSVLLLSVREGRVVFGLPVTELLGLVGIVVSSLAAGVLAVGVLTSRRG